MIISIMSSSQSQNITGVIGVNVLDGDKPTIQVIHKTGDTIHCDLFQSEDYTGVTVQIRVPTGN
jgi:hypothetical protein